MSWPTCCARWESARAETICRMRRTAMNVIDQRLIVKEWPLKKPGDELFAGYVVAVGVFPCKWSEGGMFPYADFAYNDSYSRYRLPSESALINELLKYLCSNLETIGSFGDIYGKVWVRLTEKGYEV